MTSKSGSFGDSKKINVNTAPSSFLSVYFFLSCLFLCAVFNYLHTNPNPNPNYFDSYSQALCVASLPPTADGEGGEEFIMGMSDGSIGVIPRGERTARFIPLQKGWNA